MRELLGPAVGENILDLDIEPPQGAPARLALGGGGHRDPHPARHAARRGARARAPGPGRGGAALPDGRRGRPHRHLRAAHRQPSTCPSCAACTGRTRRRRRRARRRRGRAAPRPGDLASGGLRGGGREKRRPRGGPAGRGRGAAAGRPALPRASCSTFLGLREELAERCPRRRVVRPALPRPHLSQRRPWPGETAAAPATPRPRRPPATGRGGPALRAGRRARASQPPDACQRTPTSGPAESAKRVAWPEPPREVVLAKKKDRYVVGLDIGTHKVCAIVAEITDEGRLDVIGIGQAESKGLRKGVVINLEATVDVHQARGGGGGADGRGRDRLGLRGPRRHPHPRLQLAGRDRGLRQEPRDRARGRARASIEAAKAVSIPVDREILHVLPQEFVVDDQDGIGDPTGMTGTRLEVNVHVVTCSSTAAQNTVTCVNRAGLEVIDTVLTQIAAAEACLTPGREGAGGGAGGHRRRHHRPRHLREGLALAHRGAAGGRRALHERRGGGPAHARWTRPRRSRRSTAARSPP